MRSLFAELKRRKVFRVMIVYVVTAWVLMQAGDILLDRFGAPEWFFQSFVVLLGLGFPMALVLAWAFELTPDGVRRDSADSDARAPDAIEGSLPSPRVPLIGMRAGILAIGSFVLIVAMAGLGWTLIGDPMEEEPPAAQPGAPDFNSIAVLPFDNFGNDREDYFSDGMTEDIIAQLTSIPDLTVINRSSAMRYRNTELSLREIGRELSARVILEGSVRRADGRVRIVAQLIEVATDTHLWAETYDREIEDVFAVQSEVAREIASALGRTLGRRAGEEGGGQGVASTDPETYELYLRGRHLWHQRGAAPLVRAIEYYEEAIGRDPTFAPAHAALADASLVLPIYDPSLTLADAADRARAAAGRALLLDPDLGEAHATLGTTAAALWDWETADRHFVRALQLNPGYAEAHHWYGVFLLAIGRHAEGIERGVRALELDPFSIRTHMDLAVTLMWTGRNEEAAGYFDRGAELNPGFPDFYRLAFTAYSRSGREEAALESLVRIQRLSPESVLRPEDLRSAFLDQGLAGAVRLVLDRAPETLGGGVQRAQMEFYVGDTESVIRSLEQAMDAQEFYSAWLAADLALSAALGPDPRFQALMRRIGLPWP